MPTNPIIFKCLCLRSFIFRVQELFAEGGLERNEMRQQSFIIMFVNLISDCIYKSPLNKFVSPLFYLYKPGTF